MTILADPVTPLSAAPLDRALLAAGARGWLVLVDVTEPLVRDAAETAVRRETRAGDWVGRHGAELVVVLTVPLADLDAVADRLLSVVERATGTVAAAGVCRVAPDLPAEEHLDRARRGLAVAWACGGSRAVRYP